MASALHARCTPRLNDTRPSRVLVAPRTRVVLRAEADEEDFEKRLAWLNKSKVPTGVSRKDLKKNPASSGWIIFPLCLAAMVVALCENTLWILLLVQQLILVEWPKEDSGMLSLAFRTVCVV